MRLHKLYRTLYQPYCFSLLYQIPSYQSQSLNSLRRSDAYICSKLTIIGSDNGLSPGWRQAIIWTNAGILLIRTLGTNFSEILSEIHAFSYKKIHLKLSYAKFRLFCLGLNVLTHWGLNELISRLPLFNIHMIYKFHTICIVDYMLDGVIDSSLGVWRVITSPNTSK